MDPKIRRWIASFPTEEESAFEDVEPYRNAPAAELDWAICEACC